MKKLQSIIIALACVGAILFALRPMMALKLAKWQAIRKLSPFSATIDSTPSTSILNISNLNVAPPFSTVELSGCEIVLPEMEFKKSSTRKEDITRKAYFTNDNFFVVIYGAIEKSNYVQLESELNCSNVFDLVSSAYHTTVEGISEQRNMDKLQQYLALITYKTMFVPNGSEHSWQRFDRGDFSGFISGDLAKDKRIYADIYIKEKDQFLGMLIVKQSSHMQMTDVYHVLSVLKIKPDT